MAKEIGTCEWVTKATPAMRQNWMAAIRAAMTLLLCVAQGSTANADPASCLEKVTSYVTEVDQLLATEKNWITPFDDLNKRYFEFGDCDTDALLEVVWRSRFFQRITYNPRAKEYRIVLSSKDVRVGFAYDARSKRSNTLSAVWVNK